MMQVDGCIGEHLIRLTGRICNTLHALYLLSQKRREETAWPLLFLNNNDPVFCNPYLGPFFKVPDPKKISGRPDKLE